MTDSSTKPQENNDHLVLSDDPHHPANLICEFLLVQDKKHVYRFTQPFSDWEYESSSRFGGVMKNL